MASPGRDSPDQAANAVSPSSAQDDLPLEFHGMLQDKTESVVPQEYHPISGEYGTLQFKVRRLSRDLHLSGLCELHFLRVTKNDPRPFVF